LRIAAIRKHAAHDALTKRILQFIIYEIPAAHIVWRRSAETHMQRTSGVLHHITSLPSAFGIGDLGPEAYRFADFLASAGQRCWQVLPIHPTDVDYDSSPYLSCSSRAGNPLLISPEMLMEEGLVSHRELQGARVPPGREVDYVAAASGRQRLIHRAYRRWKRNTRDSDYDLFCRYSGPWLDGFALFAALRAQYRGTLWYDWPASLRDRQDTALQQADSELHEDVERIKFEQYLFFRQWDRLKRYCNGRGIHFFGDIPIYMNIDAEDVWVHPRIFKLDENKKPAALSGVPPDYFSATGQLWGNPVYCWDTLREQGYAWWMQRVEHNLHLFDLVRIDHFRGLVAYWEVPAGETTAINGRWVEAPAHEFFSALFRRFMHLPVIAEDLGTITPDVREVMRTFGLPGMRVLQFAFGEDGGCNPYLPHNVPIDSVMYVGTHDNATAREWFEHDMLPEEKKRLCAYLGREVSGEELPWEMIRLAMTSVAQLCIVTTQDILGLGREARMNRPGTEHGNWRWRLLPGQLTDEHAARLRDITQISGRA
jgi:4-alpha-glucanotransferase